MIFSRAPPGTTRLLNPHINSLEGLAAHICSLVHTFASKIACEDIATAVETGLGMTRTVAFPVKKRGYPVLPSTNSGVACGIGQECTGED
jgi:hypothetical protein